VYVVTVAFAIKPAHLVEFRSAMIENATASRRFERGCRQFDVCADPLDPASIFLYELYDDRDAFDEHLASAHFREFDARVREWVASKTVRFYERVDP
jgi:(4S)-4-hydroxy-5-phosphonooxypentane-2,3-dione isomerase